MHYYWGDTYTNKITIGHTIIRKSFNYPAVESLLYSVYISYKLVQANELHIPRILHDHFHKME